MSEAYATKAACMNGIESVKKNAADDSRYRRTTTPNGKFHSHLRRPTDRRSAAAATSKLRLRETPASTP